METNDEWLGAVGVPSTAEWSTPMAEARGAAGRSDAGEVGNDDTHEEDDEHSDRDRVGEVAQGGGDR